MAERDYVLGTHDEEIARLGLQHELWRPRMLAGWDRAGFTAGMRIVDVGAGPGYATVDLAARVGPRGEVVAVERSQRFAAHLGQASRSAARAAWPRCAMRKATSCSRCRPAAWTRAGAAGSARS